MAARIPPLAFALALALPFAPLARAEDAAPEGPAAEPAPAETPKPAKAETDDTSIFKDWKLVKQRGVAHSKKRAEFWAGKGAAGKDLIWLGLMYERGEDYPKAIEALKGYLDWKPPEGDAKAADTKQKNLELAWKTMILAHTKNRDWPGTIKACETFREEMPGSALTAEMFLYEGRAHRMAGDDAKAIDAFGKAADLKYVKATLDLADVYLCNGDVAGAKSAIARLPMEDAKGRDFLLQHYLAFLDMVGTSAPSLEKAVSVGSGDAPKDWSKPTVLYFWGMQTANADRRLKRLEDLRRAYSDKIQAAGISKYQKYNPQTMKVEEGMTEEQEQEWLRKLIADSPQRLPPMIVVPGDLADAMKIKFEGQITLVDKDGKYRYVRLTDMEPYDIQAVEMAVKKVLGN
jgi:tetratricopeptide (TPR) repeat protein